MNSSSIVVNTSPWISLSICGQIDILDKLYERVLIPKILEGGIYIHQHIVDGILYKAGELK